VGDFLEHPVETEQKKHKVETEQGAQPDQVQPKLLEPIALPCSHLFRREEITGIDLSQALRVVWL
jgi:hypothetical protein